MSLYKQKSYLRKYEALKIFEDLLSKEITSDKVLNFLSPLQNYLSKSNYNLSKQKYHIRLNWFDWINIYIKVSLDIIFKVLLLPRVKPPALDVLFLSYAESHKKILQPLYNIIKSKYKTGIVDVIVSFKDFRKVIQKSGIYLDQFLPGRFVVKAIFVKQIKMRKEIKKSIRIINQLQNDLGIVINKYYVLKYLVEVLKSIRIEEIFRNINRNNSIKIFIQGNDTCYRSNLLTRIYKSKSIVIQHGLIIDRFMYYSNSNYFFCWSEKDMEYIIKNKQTQYIYMGYPLERTVNNIQFNPESKNLIFILTYIENNSNNIFDKIIITINELIKQNFKIYIKHHPLTSIRIKNRTNKFNIHDISGLEYLAIINLGSTLGIEILIQNENVLLIKYLSNYSYLNLNEIYITKLYNILSDSNKLNYYFHENKKRIRQIYLNSGKLMQETFLKNITNIIN